MDRLTDELRDQLLELRNIETGHPVVAEVVRSDALYHGEYVDWLPDLLVLWTEPARDRRPVAVYR